ncbi:Chemotaxis protein methyltransferase Cher2 [Pseudovibrio axinellae]|uniref:protein-glutamate O-methyltransferase n=2 Tax=Pseudovibrio axinellae TaxID=989403 RepID=A0A166ACU1_9HYPH|nr:Chemotaxis protein methyltransferase Cher2 [Pseudovibrio axinellae]SER19942.1 chemotaxis protein methyltransferase CheR [Pseudovibrio axinellae]
MTSEYDFLKKFLKSRSGLVLSDEKQYLVESRLLPVARRNNLNGLSELILAISKAGSMSLQSDVVEAMTTNESFFFRDKRPFESFRNVMLPHLLDARKTRRSARIWCAAASTGQEPYSLSMYLKEEKAKVGTFRFEIIGTDISTEVLEKARTGIYSQFEVQRGLPIQMLLKYFSQQGELWQMAPEIRAMVQWRKLNLLENFSHLGEFDIIFCRNVLIYFDQQTKIDVLNRIYRQLPDDGFLVLGAAETVVGLTDGFEPYPELRGVYRKKKTATQPLNSRSKLSNTGRAPAQALVGGSRL